MVLNSREDRPDKALVAELAAHIGKPPSLHQPFVVENRIPQTHSIHVVVIWDRWRRRTRDERWSIILEAYRTGRALNGDEIRVALGLTQREALTGGFLPFKVVSNLRKSDRVSPKRIRQAMASVGGVAAGEEELRFPTEELAREAYRQLAARVAGPYWAMVQEVAAVEA